jgi:hypothetical protein
VRVTTHNTRRGFPIRRPSDHSSFISSPRLIADYRVLHRLLMPRHPPCALKNLPHDHRTHRYHHHHTPQGGTAAVSRRSITNTAPQPTRHTPRKGSDARLLAAPVLKMLASTIQFSNNNPHTLHTGGSTPAKGTRPPAGRREPRHNTPTPTRGRGLLSQDPIVRHGPHPPPDRSLPPPTPDEPHRVHHGGTGTRTRPGRQPPHPPDRNPGSTGGVRPLAR